jgi:hypothetical protein
MAVRRVSTKNGTFPRRESFRRDALDAWGKYQAAGQHLTAAEVDAWLGRLEAGEDAEPPPPHGLPLARSARCRHVEAHAGLRLLTSILSFL